MKPINLTGKDSRISQIKGIGILLIVYGHNDYSAIGEYVYSFHIPLFFILSGVLESPEKYTLKEYLLRKFKRLLLPYFCMSGLLYLFWLTVGRQMNSSQNELYDPIKNLMGIFYSQGGNEYMNWGIPLWFLPALFLVNIIAFLIIKHIKKPFIPIAYIMITILGWLLYAYNTVRLPWSLDVVCPAMFFFFFGRILKGFLTKDHPDKIIFLLAACLFIVHFFGFLYNTPINMYHLDYGNFLLLLFNGITGSSWLILLLMLIPTVYPFTWMGENSIPIMGFHLRALSLIKGGLLFAFGFILSSEEISPGVAILLSIGQVILLAPLIILLNRYLPWIVGRN